ncbi:hypothetical protein EYF80_016687 [Liparis tanakae]|uniref:Uncharacterized protein n=1 Tax=Liparis tanakae TaxID=230148 RepID=A0A4Z2I4T5_9TELE|nr:hypothetical protein EYF80_016687 [Liparis tanakae]
MDVLPTKPNAFGLQYVDASALLVEPGVSVWLSAPSAFLECPPRTCADSATCVLSSRGVNSYVLLTPWKPQKLQRFSRLAPTPVSSCLKVQGSRERRASTSPLQAGLTKLGLSLLQLIPHSQKLLNKKKEKKKENEENKKEEETTKKKNKDKICKTTNKGEERRRTKKKGM